MNTRKQEWWVIITAFQVGFCGNAVLWRLSQHKTDDIFFPAIIATLLLVALVVNAALKREEPNTQGEERAVNASPDNKKESR